MIKQKIKPVDKPLLILTIALIITGLAMLWSASTVESQKQFGNSSYFALQSLIGIGLGAVAMWFASKIDYHFWKKIIPVALVVSLLALIAVKIPGLGFSANGATRWISIGPLFFQPSEPAKLALILYLASWISSRYQEMRESWRGIIPPLLMCLVFSLMILWQPDMGTMLSVLAITLGMLFAGGINLKRLWTIIGVGIVGLLIMIKLEPYRMRRITAFINPSADPLNASYQIKQAMLAIGSGGIFGYGYGASRQKYSYLPETLNDSIFAVVAEELGFVRVTAILALFTAFIIRGLRVAKRAPDSFGKMLGIGIITSIAANTVINVGAITGLLPLTGIPLPFFSYGSSAMIINMAGIGILLNISRQGRA